MAETISIYLASGWFTPEEMDIMNRVRDVIVDMGFDLFAPYYDGIVLDKKNDTLEMRNKVFEVDVLQAAERDLIVVVVDNFDIGAMVEVGIGVGARYVRNKHITWCENFPNIIGYMDKPGKKINVMLERAFWGSAYGEHQLREQLARFVSGKEPAAFSEFAAGDVE